MNIMDDMDPFFDSYEFRNYTLEGNWKEVEKIYKTHKQAWETKIDGDRGTALHVAVNDGLEDVVKELIDVIINNNVDEEEDVTINNVDEGGEDVIINDEGEEENIEKVLRLRNERGDTPLHLAASRGFKIICKLIIGENGERKHLIKAKNVSGETPLFLAALSWQKQTFAYLFKVFQPDLVNLRVLIRDLDGDTILHSAIRREFFDLAVIIINHCPELHDIQNQNGMTPLKLLANRPSAFRSRCKLTWWRQIKYNCIVVQEIDAEATLERYYLKEDKPRAEKLQFPENYRTCYEFSWFAEKLGLGTCKILSKNKGSDGRSATDEHIDIIIHGTSQCHAQEKIKQSLVPPNYATCSLFLKDAYLYVLGLSGAGVKEMRKIKKKHIWGGQLLRALMQNPSESYMGSGGQPIQQYKDETSPFYVVFDQKEKTYRDAEEKNETMETAFLIAAKNGILEIVDVIATKIPSAMYETTTDKKNVFHVAVKNKQPLVVEFLLKILRKRNTENLIQALDSYENTVLHLAAETLSSETRPEGSAMQMMWEIKWFEYVKELLPYHFILIKNKENKTSGELFKESHKMLVKESNSWLKEISTVVAALVSGVAFATVSTIPGWTEGGKPSLEGQPVFNAFAISSLIALVSSVTALILFLSLLTTQKQAQDFRRILPSLLLSGLTFMFLSIVAMFFSFCTGHFFLLNHKYKHFAFPIYVAAGLPVAFYAVAQFPLYLALLNIILSKVPKPLDI